MNQTGMKKWVVVAVDGSTPARNAAKIAIQIAAAKSLLIEGFYIVDEHLILDPYANSSKELGSDPGLVSRDVLIEKFEQKGFSELDQLEKSSCSKDVSCITNVLIGGVTELILEYAKRASLLVLGRRGNGHAEEKDRLGDNFRRIAHRTNVPLIVGGEVARPIKRIFLVYDDSEQASQAAEWAFGLQQAYSSELVVGWIGEKERKNQPETLYAKFSSKGMKIEKILDFRSIPMGEFIAAINVAQADLIIMSGDRRPEIVTWLVGSPVDEILRGNPLPVLIV